MHSPSSSADSQGPVDEQDSDGDQEQYVYFKKRGQDFKIKIDSSDECELSAEENQAEENDDLYNNMDW